MFFEVYCSFSCDNKFWANTVTFPLTSCAALSLIVPTIERLKCQEREEKMLSNVLFYQNGSSSRCWDTWSCVVCLPGAQAYLNKTKIKWYMQTLQDFIS